MNEIVSFSKEIDFNDMLNKITSIALDHTLISKGSEISGDLIVSGNYKQTIASQIETPFSYKIPVEIELDSKYDLSNVIIDIDDFTYDVIDEKKLKINVDILIDKLELKKENKKEEKIDDELISVDDLFSEINDEKKLEIPINNKCNENKEEKKEEKKEENKELISEQHLEEKDDSLFSNLSSSNETYSTYKVYIVKEDDSLEKILEKYNISKVQLEDYNDLSNISKGTKLIIPDIND